MTTPPRRADGAAAADVVDMIGDVLDQLDALGRAEAARERDAREARVALAGLGARLRRARSLAAELDWSPRRSAGAPRALAHLRGVTAVVAAELDRRLPGPRDPDVVPRQTLVEALDLAERLRTEVVRLHERLESAPAAPAAPADPPAAAPRASLGPSLLRAPAPFDLDPPLSAPRDEPSWVAWEARAVAVAAAADPPVFPVAPVGEPGPPPEQPPPAVPTWNWPELEPRRRPRAGRATSARGGTWLARTLRDLGRVDPDAAADLALALIAAQEWRRGDRLVYTVRVRDVASFLITIENGFTTVEEFSTGAPAAGQFHIDATLREFTDFATGALRRRGGGLKVTGNRRRLHRLLRSSRSLTLADAAELDLALDADLVLLALATAIRPEWTLGYSYTVAFDVTGPRGGTWLVRVADGRRVTVTSADPRVRADCRLVLPQDALLGFLTNRADPLDPAPLLDGDKHAAVMLLRWMTRGQDQIEAPGPRRLELERAHTTGDGAANAA